ncbi:TonB-dependent receptor family protein [Sorangium sp. So ce1097]|uniref:TonB-dependent receptor family protein n=1 Tax=Sorangium sp. So ce1097 TaxID=3133330 RepID=UPI003F60FA6E
MLLRTPLRRLGLAAPALLLTLAQAQAQTPQPGPAPADPSAPGAPPAGSAPAGQEAAAPEPPAPGGDAPPAPGGDAPPAPGGDAPPAPGGDAPPGGQGAAAAPEPSAAGREPPVAGQDADAPAQAAPGGDAPAAGQAAPEQAEPRGDAPVEVTVAGTRVTRTAGSAHVIKGRQLERFEHDDPHAVLGSVPGVYVRGEDGLGLRPNIGVRGVNPDRSKKVTLMEDGVPISPAPYSAPAAYYFPLITRMANVRVIKGPGAIAYGPQTVGGTVDLVTRSAPSLASGALDLALGEYGYGKAHAYLGTSDGQMDFLVEGVHLRSDGFKELPSGADTGFYRNEVMLKGSYVVDPTAATKNELRLKLTYSDELSNETYLGLTDEDFEANPLRRYGVSALDRMRNHRTAVALTHVLEPSRDLSVTTTVYRSDFSRAWRKVNGFRGANLFDVLTAPDAAQHAVYHAVLTGQLDSSTPGETLLIGPNEREFAAHGVETRVRWNTATGPVSHRVEYGLRLHYDRVERRHSENGFHVLGGTLVPDGGPTVVTQLNEAWTEAIALHATDAATWRALTVTPGVRVELMRSAFVDRAAGSERKRLAQAVLPGVGAYYAITEELGILAGVYRGFSPPAPGSDAHVEPELSVNYEGGARFADGPLRAEIIGYYNDYANMTDVCTLSSGCLDADLDRQYDAGEARIYGVEAYAEHEIPVGELKVPINAAYTLTRTEFLSSFTSDDPIFGRVAKGDEMPYVPRHQASLSVGVEHERGGLVVGASYVSAMREKAGGEPMSRALVTDEQFLIDASARVRVVGPLVLYANARNVLGSQFIVSRRPFGARPNAPRWIQVGVKASF